MILVVGGLAAGKREWTSVHLGYRLERMSDDPAGDAPVLYDVQNLAAKWEPDLLLPLLLAREVVICNEVGCGVVPVTRDGRESRERVGRLCILLAQNAQAVVRVCCGIGTVLKGTLP